MKTNIINLYNKFWIWEKPPTELEFWDEIWVYKKVNGQRTINLESELTTIEFKEAYKRHLEEAIKVKTDWKFEPKKWVFIMGRHYRSVVIYYSHKNEIYKRRTRFLKKQEMVRIGHNYYPIKPEEDEKVMKNST